MWIALPVFFFLAIPAAPHLLGRKIPEPSSGSVDAVIVLTGGGGRIAEGFKVWKAGSGWDLCILGTGKNTKLTQLLPEADTLSEWELSRIHTEGWSGNTLENAFSAKALVEERKYSSIILVTSDYHIPRAYHTFKKVLSSGVDISVIRVNTENGKLDAAWRWARRHFVEGWKYWGYRILLLWV
ncbi:MAG: YdcF family protein [Syntrophorhabdaceae bacterium]|nr:YdcF family protein [Syntrophorhabdaceae bacterium]